MKYIRQIAITILILPIFHACQEWMEVGEPTLDVALETQNAVAGEPVVFSFTGDANLIVFWSGEPGSDYEYRNGRTVSLGWESLLSFNSKVEGGTQKDQLTILISNRFDGDYGDYDNIIHTPWEDVTNWFTLATGTTAVSSTARSLSGFVEPGIPLFVAFRYITREQAIHGTPAKWSITNFSIVNKTQNAGNMEVLTLLDGGFRLIDPFEATASPSRSSVTQSQITMQGNFYGYDNEQIVGEDIETEHWIISKPIYLSGETDAGPDRPLAVKGFEQIALTEYEYVYREPGVYYATFVCSNQSIGQSREKVKTIRVEVE